MRERLRDRHRVDQTVEPVDHEHDVGGFGRGGRAARAHRDADVGRRERRRVVQPVADHHHDAVAALGLDGFDLLVRGALGQDPVDAERGADRLRHVRDGRP